ncbi:carboxypeptidase-like regulatory domain-containing protein [uncultured Rubinisphaera sp.]|uniref:carboxypeptidase-like regulatory domain-containing protein n=1 Tax=uncultured Rubinisphaera sp. TaxID=1678686 RepID=UPI0030DC88AB|tara:strand:+ start:100 stop:504 length:405 start_codon:yes stop_codon:yes gene_type:complete
MKLHLVLLFFVLTSLINSGCSTPSPDQPELGTVSGIVTLDEQPLPNVLVSFTPETGPASYATTGEDGRYELIYLDNHKGAVIGKHTVTITTPTDAPTGPEYKDPIPEKYNSNTTLTVEVSEGDNPYTDFALSTK